MEGHLIVYPAVVLYVALAVVLIKSANVIVSLLSALNTILVQQKKLDVPVKDQIYSR